MTRINFCSSTMRLLIVIVAALIMLSAGAVVTEGSRRCYWCGPLAEQVHRSQRAPVCDDLKNHVTDCDPGFTHCAVVATSPPYVESRLCVKLYQDECYPLYCNSSKTWRMTCPCQGNLCNGPNTEREINAFSVLPKLVMKTKSTRINKRGQQTLPVQFIQNKNEKSLIITNISAIDNESIDNNENDYSITDIVLSNETQSNIVNIVQNSSTIETTETILTLIDTDKLLPTNNIKMTVTDLYDNDIETGTETQTFTKTNKPQETTVETKIIHIPRMIKESKTSEKLPTAEALQQNASPVIVNEKTTLTSTPTNTETTLQTTLENNIERTTEHSKAKKNKGVRLNDNKIFWAIIVLIASLVNCIYH